MSHTKTDNIIVFQSMLVLLERMAEVTDEEDAGVSI